MGAVIALAILAAAALLISRPGSSSPGSSSVDAGFARDMAVHHQQAVELSIIVRDRAGSEDVRTLAFDVINTQANQRGMLLGWLELWGLPKTSQDPPMAWMGHGGMNHDARDGSFMPGMATNAQVDELRAASSKAAEVLYLRLLTAHHRGGVEMAQAAADRAETDVVRRLAQGMVEGQRSEMKLMADMLTQRGAGA
ncbi:DUF305 domain-containing protein [Streptomyces sp. NBC_00239]|uniref:DUF305 domain-containing protein n=1 Tax=Streptomyces sp. NBC_00239 TaxID=2903640 RepID=UPI002E2C466E|nr:DUF305 domain-containing protein [Streptomyces sp. NBC_00239]